MKGKVPKKSNAKRKFTPDELDRIHEWSRRRMAIGCLPCGGGYRIFRKAASS